MAFGIIAETQRPVGEMTNTTENKVSQLEKEIKVIQDKVKAYGFVVNELHSVFEKSIAQITEKTIIEINKDLTALHDDLIK